MKEYVLSTPGLGVANAIIEVRGGGFAAVGYADAGLKTGTDVVLIRFDSAGDMLWMRSYGGDREDFGWDVVEAPDGGFFVVGFTEAGTAGHEDVLVRRVDALGEPIWDRTMGGAGRDRAWSATMANGGGIVIAAESERDGRERDAYVICLDGDGETRWERTIDAQGDQRVFQVARTDDGAFVFAGTTAADGQANRDVYVVRVDSGGNPIWTRSFGGEPDDVGHGIMALAGGDALVTGYGGTRSNGGTDMYLLRVDPAGDLKWWQHAGSGGNERAMMSTQVSTGGYISVGYSMTPTGPAVLVWDSDPDGNVQTQAALGRMGRGVMILAPRSGDGEYVLAGTLGSSRPATGDFAVLWLRR